MNRDDLIVSHFHLVDLVVDEYLSRRPKWKYLRDEMVSLGGELIIKYADKYDPKKAEFRTYFSSSFRGKLKNIIRKEITRLEREVPYDESVLRKDVEEVAPHVIYNNTDVLDFLESTLSEEDMEIVNLNLTGSLTNREAAKELGIGMYAFRKRKSVLIRRIKRLLELEGELLNEKLR